MAIGEVQLAPISAHTLRLSVLPGSRDGSMPVPPSSSELAIRAAPPPLARIRSLSEPQVVAWSGGKVELSTDPLVVAVTAGDGRSCQRLRIENGEIRFALGDGRLFGLGQGGQQFDRRGGSFPLVNGQGEGVHLGRHAPAGRACAALRLRPGPRRRAHHHSVDRQRGGWAIFFHRPYGSLRPCGDEGRLIAGRVGGACAARRVPRRRARAGADHARVRGDHRFPASAAALVARLHAIAPHARRAATRCSTKRRSSARRHLPCDAFIYLGTGFTTGGWNIGHGQFAFNRAIFPDPDDDDPAVARRSLPRRVACGRSAAASVRHRRRHGRRRRSSRDNAAHYWNEHQPVPTLGVDGWWPDVGDMLDPPARLARIRMYWDGPIRIVPTERPSRSTATAMPACSATAGSGRATSTPPGRRWRCRFLSASTPA